MLGHCADGKLRLLQQLTGIIRPVEIYKGTEMQPQVLADVAGKVIIVIAQCLGKIVQSELFQEMGLYIADDPLQESGVVRMLGGEQGTMADKQVGNAVQSGLHGEGRGPAAVQQPGYLFGFQRENRGFHPFAPNQQAEIRHQILREDAQLTPRMLLCVVGMHLAGEDQCGLPGLQYIYLRADAELQCAGMNANKFKRAMQMIGKAHVCVSVHHHIFPLLRMIVLVEKQSRISF